MESTVNYKVLIPCLGVAFFGLTGCGSSTPKTKVIVVEPEAVIESNVYIRYPKTAYEKLQLGGAALRGAGYEFTLNPNEGALPQNCLPCVNVAPQGATAEQEPPVLPSKNAKSAQGTGKSIYSKKPSVSDIRDSQVKRLLDQANKLPVSE